MQINSLYLYPNYLDVYTNSPGSWTTERYRRVYNRNLKIYRSVDNRIDLQVRNSDQKPQNISNYHLVFNILTREGDDLLLSKDCTSVSGTGGRVYVSLSEEDLYNIENGFYNYSIVRETRNYADSVDPDYIVTEKSVLYFDSQYGAIGTLEVSGDVLGNAEPSVVIDKFNYVNPATLGQPEPEYYVSSIIDTNQAIVTADSIHTFQFYTTDYEGSVTIEGSLEDGAIPSNWVTISSNSIDPGTNEFSISNQPTVYKNVTGKWNFFRIKHFPTSGTLDKILYR